jgi:hypothetical protein
MGSISCKTEFALACVVSYIVSTVSISVTLITKNTLIDVCDENKIKLQLRVYVDMGNS